MGNIAAATGLVKKDDFPTDMNVRKRSFPVYPPLFIHTRATVNANEVEGNSQEMRDKIPQRVPMTVRGTSK
jgi:hypothetical protein